MLSIMRSLCVVHTTIIKVLLNSGYDSGSELKQIWTVFFAISYTQNSEQRKCETIRKYPFWLLKHSWSQSNELSLIQMLFQPQ